ncbi:MAG: hypothetical protein NC548_61170 [Lachnospiraceae bacterium]|nr:hypothetical protein [Lachnospiraceae bacterium]
MKQYDIYLRNRITELDVAIRELAVRNDISIRAKIYLLVDEVMSSVTKFIGIYNDGELATSDGVIICTQDGKEIIASNKYLPNFILDSSCGKTAKTVYEHIRNVSTLAGEVNAAIASKVAGEIKNDMRLESGTVTLLQEWLYSCSALRNTLISSDIETAGTAYFGADARSKLLTEMTYPPVAVKAAYSLEDTLELTHFVGSTLEYLLGAEYEKLTLSSTVNALLTRYRILGEMDADKTGADLTLEEFDDMTLEDIDFVVIE